MILKGSIEKLRKLLYEELDKKDTDSKKVLKLSQKLDEIIVAYYESKNEFRENTK